MGKAWPVPYFLDPAHFTVDALVSFCLGILLAVMVSAEAQAFTATILGDSRLEAKDRFNFNAFLHLDILGTINYLVGGFGWARPIEIDPDKFAYPRLYTFLTRLAGPLANLFLAGIAGSLVMIMQSLEFSPRVFNMVVGVNVTTAVYNLVPLPPLVAGILLTCFIPGRFAGVRRLANQVGPFIIVALTLVDRLYPQYSFFRPWLDPLVLSIFHFISSS